MENTNIRYKGRFGQTFIYLGKLFRMFIFQNDWKVLPMAAIIAGMVSIAIGNGLFTTMEGTLQGTLALSCVCIWNGFFNSIQSVCRERAILKREHRAGLHITSYVMAHLIYQFFLCAMQTGLTITVCAMAGVKYQKTGLIFGDFRVDLFITLFLITYAADVLALMISALVHSTTSAMTVMPFMLIVQLVFAGFFGLPDSLSDVSSLMISKWGLQGLCALGHYNDLPAVVIWHKMRAAGDMDLGGIMTLGDAMDLIEKEGLRDELTAKLGQASRNELYVSTQENLFTCWGYLFLFVIIFAFVTVVCLEFIDRDRR